MRAGRRASGYPSRTITGLALALAGLLALPAAAAGNDVAGDDVAGDAAVSQGSGVPAPEDVIGFVPGEDYKLADYGQISAYFRALADASDRVILEQIGTSTQGKPMLMAIVSSAENLARIERYKSISRTLALARMEDEGEAARLATEGKAVVWIDSGLHATEVAHGQHAPLLAHWLATSEDAEARRVRDRVITLVIANMNPDGLDIVANWYRSVVGTPFETARVPELYHPYIGHDNNRDWYMFTQVEHQAVADQLYREWFPQVVYNHHQTSPFPARIWMPPVEDPINPNIDPVVVTSLNLVGEAMKRRFSQEEKPGAISGVIFDGWWSGYMSDAVNYHNMIGLITETGLYSYATPHCYDDIPSSFGSRADNLSAVRPSINYPDPWPGGCWHLADAVDYMLTADRALLDLSARRSDELLMNIWRMGRRQIARGENAVGGAHSYIVDLSAQRDPGRALAMLRALRRGGIEVLRAEESFQAPVSSSLGATFGTTPPVGNDESGEGDGSTAVEYPAGTYILPPQPFRPFLVDLMEPKDYPDLREYPGGPPDPPYDMTGYEFPEVMGVRVDRVAAPYDAVTRAVDRPEDLRPRPATIEGSGDAGYLLSHVPNGSAHATNLLLAAGASVAWATDEFDAAGTTWSVGTILVDDIGRNDIRGILDEAGLGATAVAAMPEIAHAPIRAPRIGLYRSWVSSMPEGWTRWLFEQYGFTFDNLYDADVRSGDLSAYDVIVLPDQDAARILNGHLAGTMPEEYTGGLGLEGTLALKRFVEDGGWLVAVDQAVDFAIDLLGLPARNTVRGRDSADFFVPGSLIRMDVDSADPLAYGVEEDAVAFFVHSQVLNVIPAAAEGDMKIERDIVTYAHFAENDYLTSGWVLGGGYLAGGGAAMRAPLGAGQVVLLSFEPHFRAQSHNTFQLLFNPLYASTMDAAVWPDALERHRARDAGDEEER